jgi:DNA-binding transcriptional LysR family regulator
MNLDHLRTFSLIAASGGISKAADRLNLSQPAASRQILALEAELGVQLFARIGRGLQLTSAGEDLLDRCRRLLDDAESLRNRARALNTGQTGLLRVGAPPQVIESILAGFVRQYRERYPNIDVQLIDDAAGNLPGRLERGELDLIEVPGGNARYPCRPLYPGHMLVVMQRTHQLAARRGSRSGNWRASRCYFYAPPPRHELGLMRLSTWPMSNNGSYWKVPSHIRSSR